jgi:hypothetical protein
MQASTDCERWIATYKTQLEHAKAVKKLQAAHARLKRAAQKKMAVYVKKPAPAHRRPARPVLAHAVKPKLTPEQMLERFNLLCGDLPDGPKKDTLDEVVDGPPFPEFVADMTPYTPFGPTDDDTNNDLIPPIFLPPYSPGGNTTGGGVPPTGGGGFGPVLGGGSGGKGGQVTTSTGGDTPTPSVGVVPEPSSVALMFTGAAAIAGLVRRRRRA